MNPKNQENQMEEGLREKRDGRGGRERAVESIFMVERKFGGNDEGEN